MTSFRPASDESAPAPPAAGWLGRIERAGNRLPDPATLFAAGLVMVVLLSVLASTADWAVTKTVLGPDGREQVTVTARNLLAAEGVWWLLSHLVENFVTFPPLGLVLVGMLGIGLAERTGFIAALLQQVLLRLSGQWLTPAVVFIGIMSSAALDAGYVVLPPLAAALYQAMGRSPLAGIAAVFAGVSAGFSANLVITGLDPLLAGFTQAGAQVLDRGYRVAVTANWWFMIASTFVLTLTGWLTTARFVETRLQAGLTSPASASVAVLSPEQRRGLRAALWSLVFGVVAVAAAVLVPGAPLHGPGEHFPRAIEVTVPLLFFAFLIPGAVYGRVAGSARSDKDLARMMGETMAGLGPYIVLAFFAAQFIAAFKYSNLGEMLAVVGGGWLAQMALPPVLLVAALVLIVLLGNLLIGSASAKYAFFAPVFVPMLMQVGISPELTQVAYRVGDSVTNVITPLNPYLIIVLALMRRYVPAAGIGTLVSLMLPYALSFGVVWMLMLALWMLAGWPLGPEGPLTYVPAMH